jgi:universal stress protein A
MEPAERTLIVGIDYSDFCIPALDQALRMTADSSATRLIPLLALPEASPSRLAEAAATTEDFVARAKDNLVRLVQSRAQALGMSPGRILPLVCFGDAADCLLAQAREQRAELLLVGTHSRHGFGHLLMGSVAEKVVREAPCSVLVARAQPAIGDVPKREPAETEDEIDVEIDEAALGLDAVTLAESAEDNVLPLGEPHLDGDRVVLHVLDVPSGQTFVCAFRDFSAVKVEPLEGAWLPPPGALERARAVTFALTEAGHEAGLFTQLFEELRRRRQARSSDLAADR